MKVPNVLISYSHKDEDWRERLMAHLKPLTRQGRIELWDDRSIGSGDDWSKEISQAINKADITILLVSANFLASDFILNSEIPVFLERQQKEGLIILPIIVRPCAWQVVDWLARLQVMPKDGRPLSSYKNQDEALFEVTQRIIDITEIVTAKEDVLNFEKTKKKKTPSIGRKDIIEKGSKDSPKQIFICHGNEDGDFAELLKLTLEKYGFDAWMDLDRLHVGVDWRNEIDDAIKHSHALIVIMTPEAKSSEYVTYEWAYASGAAVKVIPLMLKSTQIHPRLESLQYLDFTNRRARPWNRLIEELNSQIEITKK